jgi:hypothetical protein
LDYFEREKIKKSSSCALPTMDNQGNTKGPVCRWPGILLVPIAPAIPRIPIVLVSVAPSAGAILSNLNGKRSASG